MGLRGNDESACVGMTPGLSRKLQPFNFVRHFSPGNIYNLCDSTKYPICYLLIRRIWVSSLYHSKSFLSGESDVSSPSAELNNVDITIGNVNTDTFAPTVSSVGAAPNPQTGSGSVTLTAVVDDNSTGGSIIQSVEYNIGGGAWTPMSAADGAFDSTTENVTATVAAPTPVPSSARP